MIRFVLMIGAVALGLCASPLASSARADRHGDAGPSPIAEPLRSGARHHHRHARHARAAGQPLPHRGPRIAGPYGRPDFLIHAYLPRPTDKPIYNEPPPRVPGY